MNTLIKHISFDLWDTIFKSTKGSGNLRTQMVFENPKYNTLNKSLEEVTIIVNSVKKHCDALGVVSGICVSPFEQSLQIYSKLNGGILFPKDIEDLENDLADLLLQCGVTLMESNLTEILEDIKSRNITINISCNTGLYGGVTLRKLLNANGLLSLFDFTLFSDEIKYFKPNPRFFEKVALKSKYSKNEILHVGDNQITDYEGATLSGMKALLFTPKTPNYEKIYEFIN